jgi:cation diffusion facilitator CzcD-associated flavoprotein CzcO
MIKLMELFKPTVVLSKNGKPFGQKHFSSESEAKKYIKQMVKKYELKRQKGFWGNPKTRVELITNF